MTMLLFVVLLALRCLGLLEWLPHKWRRQKLLLRQMPEVCTPFTRQDYLLAFFGVLAVQWVMLFFAWLTLNQSGGIPAFLAHFWQRFTEAGDSPHYLFIAENGYQPGGEDAKWIVFYPLYPLLIRAMSVVTAGNLPLAAVLLSQICWGGCGAVALRLAGCWLKRKQAITAVLFLAVYPFAFFAMGVYTESLFLLLCMSCIVWAYQKQWPLAGVAGGLAALCRTQGMVLLLPVLWLWLMARKNQKQGIKSLAIGIIPMGFGVYLACNYLLFGNCFQYLQFQADAPWYQTTQWIGNNLALHWQLAFQYPGLANFIYWPQIGLYFVGMALLFWGLFQGVPTEWLIWGGAYLGMSYLPGWLISGSRYMFGCIPLFLLLASIPAKRVRLGLLLVSTLACCCYTVLYLQGQAIM